GGLTGGENHRLHFLANTSLAVHVHVRPWPKKYFRSNQTGGQSGSGVGLAAVKAIVDAHGGKVVARNRQTEGTIFEIMLPATLRLTDDMKTQ
ncbi:MAG: ATP-binding protein, partial [Chloroflexota bacterium]